MLKEPQVESCEHQDNPNIHCQPFPEPVFEERKIYTDYHGCDRNRVKRDSYLPAHFSLTEISHLLGPSVSLA